MPSVEPIDYVIDVLHVMLRIVPALFKWTVGKHLSPKGMEDVANWFREQCDKIIGNCTAVQSGTGREASLSSASWPGETCVAVLDMHEELLEKAWGLLKRTGCPAHVKGKAAWKAFMNWNYEVSRGCDDGQHAKDAHADRLETLGEDFRLKLLNGVVPADKFTPYMHLIVHHLHPQARRYGSLVRFSSQGLEALHQWVKFTANNRSNRQLVDVPKVVLRRATGKAAVLATSTGLRHKDGGKRKRANKTGGHRSIAANGRHAQARARHEDAEDDAYNEQCQL